MVAAAFRTTFARPDAAGVQATWDTVHDQLAERFAKSGPFVDDAKAEVLAFTASPRAYWTKTWSTNSSSGSKGDQTPRPWRGDLPQPAAVIRLVGQVLNDMHDEWQAGDRRYLSEASMAAALPRQRKWIHRRHQQRRLVARVVNA